MISEKYSILSQKIISKGYTLKDLGIYEYAWKKSDIVDILQVLKEKKIAVLGGDVYRLDSGKVYGTYDSWFINDDGSNEFIEKSLEKVMRYINDYERMNGTNFVYAIVF